MTQEVLMTTLWDVLGNLAEAEDFRRADPEARAVRLEAAKQIDYSALSFRELAFAAEEESAWMSRGARDRVAVMRSLESIDDSYGLDTGTSVVAYFLSAAGTWKGPVARGVKAALRHKLKEAYTLRDARRENPSATDVLD